MKLSYIIIGTIFGIVIGDNLYHLPESILSLNVFGIMRGIDSIIILIITFFIIKWFRKEKTKLNLTKK